MGGCIILRLLHKTLQELAKKYKPKRYLEIGVREGASLKAVLNEYLPNRVALCDNWGSNYGGTGCGNHNHIWRLIVKYPDSQKIHVIFLDGDSHDKIPELIKKRYKFDLITVDGDHSYNGAMSDLVMCWELLTDGGLLVFDDVIHKDHMYLRNCIESFIDGVNCRVLIANFKDDNGIVVIMKNKEIKVADCECGSDFAVAYWNEEKQKFTCKLCVGYPDDSQYYKNPL